MNFAAHRLTFAARRLTFAARHGNRALLYINFRCSYGFVHNLFTRSKTMFIGRKSY